MTHKYFYLFSLLLLAFSLQAKSQKSHKDSSIFISSLSLNYSYQIAAGDMVKSYGNYSTIGSDFTMKFKKQILLGASFSYFFSKNVKDQGSYFNDISTSKGVIIDGNGQYAEVYVYHRGYNLQLFTGYQFTFWSANPNSGPFVQLGVGFMEYWTRIENPDKTAPQVRGDNQKMYDRLRNGLSTSQFIGYRHFGNRNLTNFYIGIELTQAWTQNRRDYNADLLGVKMVTNTDFTTGLKVGWMIPFYRKAPQKYYYY